MRKAGRILAVGCSLAMLTAMVSYGNVTGGTVRVSPRLGIPVVASTESSYADVAISHVSNYVNVRTEPNTTSSIVGKIYNNCAAKILSTVDGEGGRWYQIQSGTVNGYIKAEYFITGAEAEKIAKKVGTVYITVNTDSLRLREEPNTTSRTLTLLSRDAEYIALKEEGDFVEIQVDADLAGYVHKDYVQQRVEFEQAVSLEEEKQKREEAEQRKKEAEEAIAAMEQLRKEAEQAQTEPVSETLGAAESTESIGIIAANPNETRASETENAFSEGESGTAQGAEAAAPAETGIAAGNRNGPGGQGTAGSVKIGPGAEFSPGVDAGPEAGEDSLADNETQEGPGGEKLTSATRTAMVAYAKQFLGNPYVYGGTSLTEGADCSGFTMRLYEHFGIDIGRSSRDQAVKGREIPIESVQPGDLLFYASGDYINHVAMYVGGGQIIHASTKKTGITMCTAYYRTPYKAVTFLD